MDAQSRQQVLDNISDEELEKIKDYQSSKSGSFAVDDEWLLLTEFALKFGWQAYLDAKNDTRDKNGNLIVPPEEMFTLIEASRKLEYLGLYRSSVASFIGTISALNKKPSNTFSKLTKDFIKKMKADN